MYSTILQLILYVYPDFTFSLLDGSEFNCKFTSVMSRLSFEFKKKTKNVFCRNILHENSHDLILRFCLLTSNSIKPLFPQTVPYYKINNFIYFFTITELVKLVKLKRKLLP